MGNLKISTRYAKSIVDLATERGLLEVIYNDASYFKEVCKNAEFVYVMKSPVIKADKKIAIFEAIFGSNVNEMTLSFFKIIINKGRDFFLLEIVDQIIVQYKLIKKITTVKFTSAVAVNEQTIDQVKETVLKNLNLQNIELETHVNEALVGGFVLEYNGTMFDASIAKDLKDIKAQFLDNVYIKKF
jgi:F-type H+-transporting ATPase subunit delta